MGEFFYPIEVMVSVAAASWAKCGADRACRIPARHPLRDVIAAFARRVCPTAAIPALVAPLEFAQGVDARSSPREIDFGVVRRELTYDS